MNNKRVLAFYFLGVLVIFSVCSCVIISYSHDPFSSRDDFVRTNIKAGRPTDQLFFAQYIRQEPSLYEKAELDTALPLRVAVDQNGHEYHATRFGLRICAPRDAQNQEIAFHLRIKRFILQALDVPSRAIFSFDGFGRIAESTAGCILLNGEDGLPYEELTAIAFCDNTSEIVLGSKRGAMIFSQGKFVYFASPRWLPDDEVINLYCWPGSSIYIKTRTGYSKIVRISLTLQEKEKYYQEELPRFRFGGLINSLHNGVRAPGDNDGLWTSLSVAADSFEYATARKEQARIRAHESVSALMMLEGVTGVPGYFARTAFRADDAIAYDWAYKKGDWNHSSTMPGWIWKGDASMDELVGHLFAYAVYYDLAASEHEKQAIRDVVGRIADRMLAHDMNIVDHRGNITKWGRGSPDYTRTNTREFLGKGPMSLGVLAATKVMAHITERPDIHALYRKLIKEYGFALSTYNAKVLIPKTINHSDDQLMFLSYYNLIMLENDPYLKSLYMLSSDRYWQIERAERNPLWNFIYCALSHNMCDIEAGLLALREVPLDLRNWRAENSHRANITKQFFRDRHGNTQSNEVLPYNERAVGRWNNNPYMLNSGGDGSIELEPVMWLLPYWLGKYHNLF